jgi:hypothetical protein
VRLATLLGALALGASGLTVTTLPRPAFPGPAVAPAGVHELVLVSSRKVGVGGGEFRPAGERSFRDLPDQNEFATGNRTFVVYGRDGSTGRYLVAYDRAGRQLYGFDFRNYAWPPRTRPGEREFVYEQPTWARESAGVLYVEHAHLTYARSSYDRNAYITAIDLKARKVLWRSPALVANARTFLVTDHYVVAGYGFTDESDYLYLLDRKTGRVTDRVALPNGPERITFRGKQIVVRTYDHVVVFRLAVP